MDTCFIGQGPHEEGGSHACLPGNVGTTGPRLGLHITLELQSLSGLSEEVTLSYHIKLILKCVPVIP